ncbi:putative GTP-binding protein EngB [Sphingomonas jeddahensis]|uniref:Probable GTP-binding protein EngB n=1 Tax=Sphingomonas jeddahensis TaxID=1915074 RepID=A0A1V2EXT1_9SPHN|nr:putative GTP-binding protein EngB [Sphingomonas jeddahensis]
MTNSPPQAPLGEGDRPAQPDNGGASPHAIPSLETSLPDDITRSAEELEHARKLFAGRIEFLKSAPALEHLPNPVVPEVAFAGRSNVGKSSLLNALTGRKSLARTSVTPGRTQELNFFDVGDPLAFRLVDMPGYGFAKAPKDMVRKWRYLVNDFLRGRVVLKRALVLIDARHGIKDVDREILEMLDKAAVGYRIVLTKADKIKASELAEVTERTVAEARKRPAAHPEIIATSSEKGMGIPELRAAVIEAIG